MCSVKLLKMNHNKHIHKNMTVKKKTPSEKTNKKASLFLPYCMRQHD